MVCVRCIISIVPTSGIPPCKIGNTIKTVKERNPINAGTMDLLESEDVFRNRWLHVTLDRFDFQTTGNMSIQRSGGDAAGVGVMLLDEQNRLLLEREFRPPVNEVLLQIPGGLTNGDEDPADCIRRELEEETGYLAGKMTYLGAFFNNPASSNSQCMVYLCRDFRPGGAVHRDAAEFMTYDWYDLTG